MVGLWAAHGRTVIDPKSWEPGEAGVQGAGDQVMQRQSQDRMTDKTLRPGLGS